MQLAYLWYSVFMHSISYAIYNKLQNISKIIYYYVGFIILIIKKANSSK